MVHPLAEGTILQQRYQIIAQAAVGDYSTVYLAHDLEFKSMKKSVAVKVRGLSSSDPGLRDMEMRNIEREADVLATLSHPAIPRMYDYFTIGHESYLVMEALGGKDLASLLNEEENFLPEERVAAWAVEICDLLEYLHGQRPSPMIHRDVKPQHVMVDNHDRTRIVGFALARSYLPGQKMAAVGTSGYAAPEQYRGIAEPRSDIFALGATLHHLLTGRDPSSEPPFKFSEFPVKSLNPGVTLRMQDIVTRATAYDPADRFESAEHMKLALIDLGY